MFSANTGVRTKHQPLLQAPLRSGGICLQGVQSLGVVRKVKHYKGMYHGPQDAPRLGTNPGKFPERGNMATESRITGEHWASMAQNGILGREYQHQALSTWKYILLSASSISVSLYLHEEWSVGVAVWKEAKSGSWLANPWDKVQQILVVHQDPLSADLILGPQAAVAPRSGLWASQVLTSRGLTALLPSSMLPPNHQLQHSQYPPGPTSRLLVFNYSVFCSWSPAMPQKWISYL